MPKIKTHTNEMNIRLSNLLVEGLSLLASNKGLNRTEYIRFLIQREMEMEIKKNK